MRRVIDRHDSFTCSAVTSVHDLDLPRLSALLDEAWQADYADQFRIVFDESFIRQQMHEDACVAVMICAQDGSLIGFELALERTLYWRRQPLRAYYAILLSISPHYRRQGLGQWMLRCLHQFLFDEQQADVIVSAFQAGYAGLPTVRQSYAGLPGQNIKSFHMADVWGCWLGHDPRPDPETMLSATRLTLSAGSTHLTPIVCEHQVEPRAIPSVPAFIDKLRTQYQAAFGLQGSYQTRYLRCAASGATTYWYEFEKGEDAQCCISFDMAMMLDKTCQIGRLGNIQTVYANRCAPRHLRQALRHVCYTLYTQGCVCVVLLDHGVVPHDILRALDFRPTGGKRLFTVRGPARVIEHLEAVHPPYFLDW